MIHPCIAAAIKKRDAENLGAGAPEMWLLALLVLLHDEKTHRTDASYAELARLVGCNERNVKLLVAKLKARGLLTVDRVKTSEGHARNSYAPVACVVTGVNWDRAEHYTPPEGL